jgi:cell division protein FtsL
MISNLKVAIIKSESENDDLKSEIDDLKSEIDERQI